MLLPGRFAMNTKSMSWQQRAQNIPLLKFAYNSQALKKNRNLVWMFWFKKKILTVERCIAKIQFELGTAVSEKKQLLRVDETIRLNHMMLPG